MQGEPSSNPGHLAPRAARLTRRFVAWRKREWHSVVIAVVIASAFAGMIIWSLATGGFNLSEETTFRAHVVAR